MHKQSQRNRFYPGSCLFISKTLSIERTAMCSDIEGSCQFLNMSCCFVLCDHARLAVVSIYRSPSANAKDCFLELHSVFSQLLSCTAYVVVVGDLNVDLLKSSSVQAEYINLFADFQFTQHVAQPTRITNRGEVIMLE